MAQVNMKLAATRAKAALRRQYEHDPWFRGVGIVPKGKTGFAVRLNIAPGHSDVRSSLPKKVGSVAVEVLVISRYKPRNR